MNAYPGSNGLTQAGEWLRGAARRNPEGLLLLAAGCALLMRSGGGFARRSEDRSENGDGWTHENGYSTASATVRSRESVSRPANEGLSSLQDVKDRWSNAASDYASDMQERVSEAAGDYADNIKSRVSDTASGFADATSAASRKVVESSRRLQRQTQTTLQSTIEGVLRDQPLAVAAAGFVAGAAVAAAFPATDAEARALGSARESLSEAVDEAGKKVMGAAGKAGERLKAAAEEKGLTSDGLKNLASDVTSTFTEAVSAGGQGTGGRVSGSQGAGSQVSGNQSSGSQGTGSQGTESQGTGSSGGQRRATDERTSIPSSSSDPLRTMPSDESGPGNVGGGASR